MNGREGEDTDFSSPGFVNTWVANTILTWAMRVRKGLKGVMGGG